MKINNKKYNFNIIGNFVMFILIMSFHCAYSQSSGNIQFTNNGVSPVPIFSLGKPAILGSAVIRKGKFYFNPEFNLGIDAKPWTIFSRVGYYLLEKKKLTIGITVNTNWYFQENKPIINNQEYQVQQYYSFEFNGEYRPRENQRFIFSYWRSDRLSKAGVLFEDFVNLAYCFDKIKFGDKNIINTKPSFFYLEDYGWLKGFFTAQTTTYQRENWKGNIFLTTSWPVSNMLGTGFIWNTGINIPF